MQIGYNIWTQDQVDHIDGLFVSLKELGSNWVGIIPSFLVGNDILQRFKVWIFKRLNEK